MPVQKYFGMLLIVGGLVCLGIGLTSGPDALVMVGGILAGTGAIFVVVNLAISPIMKSSREIAEAQGMEVSKLTGAPKLGSSIAMGRQRMAEASQMMTGFTGNAAMRANGHKGSATVTSATDTGQVSNLNPIYAVVMQVTPEGGAPYEAKVTSEVNTLGVAKAVPGTVVPVTIDAGNPQNVLIDWISVI